VVLVQAILGSQEGSLELEKKNMGMSKMINNNKKKVTWGRGKKQTLSILNPAELGQAFVIVVSSSLHQQK
jgi:hypothetical protein